MEEIASYTSPLNTDGSDTEDSVVERKLEKKENEISNQIKRKHSETSDEFQNQLLDRCKYIPMRLTESERNLLLVLENALEVCEYTDVVDVVFSYTRKSKQSRILENLIDILSISCGLILSNNLTKGENIVAGKTLNDNIGLFRDMFEIGRRYKIMNPTKMRDTYGKLIYILMDTQSQQIKQELHIEFVKPILTVELFLSENNKLDILNDPLFISATQVIDIDINSRDKHKIVTLANEKNAAIKGLIDRYCSESFQESDLRRVLESVADNNSYYNYNIKPVERALYLLNTYFDPNEVTKEFSLDLTSGRRLFSSFNTSRYMGGGAKLSHNHKQQYTYVNQSLTLWKEIMTQLPLLWYYADRDMTSEAYRLADTGQGYQRVQSCPHVSHEMRKILNRVQNRCGPWVGLSVIHLGDRDVPNALVFIDKYTQVPRILSPIVQCIEKLPSLVSDEAFHRYVSDEWGSLAEARLHILCDFFKHGFDGSGDDGGSCIDGRLTSAWNWCSKLQKKPFYYIFMFTGFQGFDGDFSK